MSEINEKEISQNAVHGIHSKRLANGQVGFYGDFSKKENGEPKYYETYTEALYANINFRNRMRQKEQGLNEHWQTPEQAKAFKERLENSKKLKQKAALADEMLTQAGAK